MTAAPDDRAALVAFESGFHLLSPLGDGDLLAEAAGVYARCGCPQPAWLLDSVARQIRRAVAPEVRRPAESPPGLSPAARAVLAHPDPPTGLLRHLEQFDRAGDKAAQANLFEAVFAHMPAVGEYWVYHRMSLVYAQLHHDDLAFLIAAMALQFEPLNRDSLVQAVIVARRLKDLGARREARRLLKRREAANPDQDVLEKPEYDELMTGEEEAAAAVAETASRLDRIVVAASELPPVRVELVGRGLPHWLRPMLAPQARPAVMLSELEDAELLIADGAVSVWDREGALQTELSVGSPPGLVRMGLERRRAGGEVVDDLRLERAVLIGDRFPAPNLCHFMLDQATRLALYTQAGFDLAETVVVGPGLVRPYQRSIAGRFGAHSYLGTAGYGRVRVGRLGVLSNCHHLRHSAHLGADWAVAAVRAAFADLTQGAPPARRLLVSRADASTRRVVNEDALYRVLQPLGFDLIVPGKLPLAEQVRAFAAATHIVAPHGAGLANIVFCAPGTHVLEIFHPHYGTCSYADLVPALRLNYAAMVAWDGENTDALYNDPAIAADRMDASLERHIRVDPTHLETWLRSCVTT